MCLKILKYIRVHYNISDIGHCIISWHGNPRSVRTVCKRQGRCIGIHRRGQDGWRKTSEDHSPMQVDTVTACATSQNRRQYKWQAEGKCDGIFGTNWERHLKTRSWCRNSEYGCWDVLVYWGIGLRCCDVGWCGVVVLIRYVVAVCKIIQEDWDGSSKQGEWFEGCSQTVYKERLVEIGGFPFHLSLLILLYSKENRWLWNNLDSCLVPVPLIQKSCVLSFSISHYSCQSHVSPTPPVMVVGNIAVQYIASANGLWF